MAAGDRAKLRQDVICPFCGLACDDLKIERSGAGLSVRAAGCALSREGFERAAPRSAPQIDGADASLDAAVARAAEILRASRLPLLGGLAADVAGVRAALRLADRIGGAVDHVGSAALFRNLSVLRDTGGVATTLSEVRNRADMLLIVGPDPRAAFPRFFERCVDVPQTMFADAPLARQVVRLGPAEPPAPGQPAAIAVDNIDCPLERLPAGVQALRAVIRDRPVDPPAGLDLDALRLAADRLRAARYGVVVWAAASLDFAGGDLVVAALSDLVRDLNRVTRCAALPLGGSDNAIGANQTCLWQTGYPLRTAFGSGVPEHDPGLFAGRRLIEDGEADALIWISAFRPLSPPARDGLPTIVLAVPGTAMAKPPAVFVPVATPGVDHAGLIFRTDGVVALPLAGLRQSDLPGVAAVLAAVDDRIAAAGGAR